MKQNNKVKLVHDKLAPIELEPDHAERVLKMPKNGGWVLPEDSPYQFDSKNGITRKVQKSTQGAKEKGADSQGDKA